MVTRTFIVILLAFIFLLNFGCDQNNTSYAQKFNKESFSRISVGDSAKKVISELGLPLRIEKIRINGGEPVEVKKPKEELYFDNDPDFCYVLSYSLQMNGRRDFERNSIRIEKSRVVSKISEIVTD